VIYDRGNSSDGWRYLEAASRDAGETTWGLYGTGVSGTGTALGTGKQNTQILLDALNKAGETGKAAQLCAQLSQGGYSDWFLPSKDELDVLYGVSKAYGFSGFKNDYFWSSSQGASYGAWSQRFSDGNQDELRNYAGCVRPIRAF
jgi:hypothetical protein